MTLRLVKPEGFSEGFRRSLGDRLRWELAEPHSLDVKYIDVRHIGDDDNEVAVFCIDMRRFEKRTLDDLIDTIQYGVFSDAQGVFEPARYFLHFMGDHGETRKADEMYAAECRHHQDLLRLHEHEVKMWRMAMDSGRQPPPYPSLTPPLVPNRFVPVLYSLSRFPIVVAGGRSKLDADAALAPTAPTASLSVRDRSPRDE